MIYIHDVTRTVTIPWDEGEVTGKLTGKGPVGVLLAHGAGTDQDHPAMTRLRDGLGAAGYSVLTFNYPYAERGSKRPDRADNLVRCHRGAAEYLAPRVSELYLAGRSMGGRIGTYLVAEGFEVSGLVLYAYPLHPAGKPDKLRVDQFPRIHAPILFFQGTRDALSRMDLFDRHIATLPRASVELLEGAGHGYRGGGWDVETITRRYTEGTTTWIEGLSSGGNSGQTP